MRVFMLITSVKMNDLSVANIKFWTLYMLHFRHSNMTFYRALLVLSFQIKLVKRNYERRKEEEKDFGADQNIPKSFWIRFVLTCSPCLLKCS